MTEEIILPPVGAERFDECLWPPSWYASGKQPLSIGLGFACPHLCHGPFNENLNFEIKKNQLGSILLCL
jgi:hypothetical protein